MYFVNHSKKEWIYIGKGDGNNVIFVFDYYNWSIKEDIRLYKTLDNTFKNYTNPSYYLENLHVK